MNKKIVLLGTLTLCITTASFAMEEEWELLSDDIEWGRLDVNTPNVQKTSQEEENKKLSNKTTRRKRNNTIIPLVMLTTIRGDNPSPSSSTKKKQLHQLDKRSTSSGNHSSDKTNNKNNNDIKVDELEKRPNKTICIIHNFPDINRVRNSLARGTSTLKNNFSTDVNTYPVLLKTPSFLEVMVSLFCSRYDYEDVSKQ